MMMRCLIAGGMDAVYDDHHDAFNTAFGDDGYQPNPNGFYALQTDFRAPSFVGLCEGKLVKVPHNELIHLPQHEYRVVFMLRSPAEIVASMHRFVADVWAEEAAVHFSDLVLPALFDALSNRGDMTIQTLNYADVVADPVAQIASLQWPIDANSAGGMVDPSLYRFRLEAL